MLDHVAEIVKFMGRQLLHIWPYLLITIPIAVGVKLSGASNFIKKALSARPAVAIIAATLLGAFSPFCSCSVIPVISALLISGVPIAPVMSFWLASPSMDPEIFFLSVSTLGWELAVWRLLSTFILSQGAGFVTHFIVKSGWLGESLLRRRPLIAVKPTWVYISTGLKKLVAHAKLMLVPAAATVSWGITARSCCCTSTSTPMGPGQQSLSPVDTGNHILEKKQQAGAASSCSTGTLDSGCGGKKNSFVQRLVKESVDAAFVVAKFMALAFFFEALITLYIPSEWIAKILGNNNTLAIPLAALIGVPLYTTNMSALGIVGGLLSQGMNPAAALSFLIAGATTTLPAMAAVYGLTRKPLFFLYVAFTLFGALLFGYLFQFVSFLF